MRKNSAVRRLLKLVGDPSTCWPFPSLRPDGYGAVRMRGRMMMAHRAMYELLVGPIPEGLTIDHLCRNRGCVNPAHLEPVTRGENVLRGETLAAANAAKTHCHRGHRFDKTNTILTPDGGRACRECGRTASREYQRRKAAKLGAWASTVARRAANPHAKTRVARKKRKFI